MWPLFSTILSCLLGTMITSWGIYLIYKRFRMPKATRKVHPIRLWMILFMLLLGLSEVGKGYRELFVHLLK